MKATLKFKFVLPEDAEEHQHVMMAGKYYVALCEVAEAFRRVRKYDAEPVTEDRYHEILREYGVVLP